MNRIAALMALFAASCVAPPAPGPADDAGGAPFTLQARPLALSTAELDGAQLGPFRFVSAAHLTAAGPGAAGFGGLSSLAREGEAWRAISDAGATLRFPLSIDGQGRITAFGVGAAAAGAIAPIRAPDARPLRGEAEVDAEGLTAAPDGGWFISLERHHRLLRIPRDSWAGPSMAGPPQTGFDGLAPNGGMEALERLADGRLLAIAEYGQTGQAGAPPYWLVAPAETAPAAPAGVFAVPDGFGVTEARVQGDLLWLLLRKFDPGTGRLDVKLQRCPLDGVVAGAPRCETALTLAPPFVMDNYEGLALLPDPAGRGTLFLVLSDDNFSATQRTLALTFLLPGG